MRLNNVCRWVCVVLLAVLPVVASAQSEGSGATSPQRPGRRELKGTLTQADVKKSFSEQFAPGLYRLTYLSETAPAVIELQADGKILGRSAPTQPFAVVLGGRSGRPVELMPTGLCSSDVAPEDTCAVGKLHFRITQSEKLTISVEGLAESPGDFQILVDPLQEAVETRTLATGGIVTSYLAFAGKPAVESPQAEFAMQLSKGQRIGILLGSPDFTTALEVLDATGKLVASNSDFNGFLDPCREVRIDRLPKFDPLSQSDSYLTFQSSEGGTYTVRVSPRYRTETGLYILRSFDVTDPRITVDQMRTGYVVGTQSPEFAVSLPAGWQSQGSQIIAYSPLPIRVELTDEAGRSLAEATQGKTSEFESGLHPQDLEMLHWSSISLDLVDAVKLANARIRVKAKEPVGEQFFLVGLGTRWGSCGGGAVEPIAVLYPAVGDFRDQGYPVGAPKMSVAELEALLYSTTRSGLRWYFLIQAPEGEDKDPEILVSSYARYVPDHVSLSELLVEFHVAIRVQFSPTSGATRLWTLVERHGYKERDWHLDVTESAKAQQAFAGRITQAIRDRTK
jgi:hypothetical protein